MEHEHKASEAAQAPAEPASVAMNGGARKEEMLTMPMAIVIAAALVSASVVYFAWAGMQGGRPAQQVGGNGDTGGTAQTGDVPAIGERDVILGDANAPVTVIEYADYQCPFCERFFTQTESAIKNDYVKSGKVRLVYRNFAFLGPESKDAAAAAECAKDQSKFWLYHDALFAAEGLDGKEHNGNLNKDLFVKLAKNVGMDTNAFAQCYDSKKYVELVEKQTAEATAAGVNSTPTTYVNGTQVVGAQPYGTFKAAIDQALAAQ
jgi:protein-disulfide isomerase